VSKGISVQTGGPHPLGVPTGLTPPALVSRIKIYSEIFELVECRKEGNRPDYHLPHLKSAPRGMPQKVPELTMLITCASGCTPICRGVIFALYPSMGLPFVCLAAHGFRASSMARGSDFGKCQTFAASAAEPGELPLWFRP